MAALEKARFEVGEIQQFDVQCPPPRRRILAVRCSLSATRRAFNSGKMARSTSGEPPQRKCTCPSLTVSIASAWKTAPVEPKLGCRRCRRHDRTFFDDHRHGVEFAVYQKIGRDAERQRVVGERVFGEAVQNALLRGVGVLPSTDFLLRLAGVVKKIGRQPVDFQAFIDWKSRRWSSILSCLRRKKGLIAHNEAVLVSSSIDD